MTRLSIPALIGLLAVCFLLILASRAQAATIPAHGLACETRAQLEEAFRAAAKNDTRWLGSIRGCYSAAWPLKAERIECSGSICKARVWVGERDSAVLHTLREYVR